MSSRIERCLAELKQQNRPALVTFITAGDPDYAHSLQILQALPAAGADIIELGMPFSDPMADGPAIQAANLRALAHGQTMHKTLAMVREFRAHNSATPLVLMGYFNPIYRYGVERFLVDAQAAGVDGLIVVDLPPEEDRELCIPAQAAGLHFIRLATPTTDEQRLPKVLQNTSGFLYYVSIAGITGAAAPTPDKVEQALQRIRAHTDLPLAVGFGIKRPEQAAAIGRFSDAVVVGSALIDCIARQPEQPAQAVADVQALVQALAAGVRGARA